MRNTFKSYKIFQNKECKKQLKKIIRAQRMLQLKKKALIKLLKKQKV